MPGARTIADGSYQPLFRNLYIYVNASDLTHRPEVAEFVTFYAAMPNELAPDVGYIALSPSDEGKRMKK